MTLNVTIGIPAYNEEKNIGNLLTKLLREKFTFNLIEIIVVNDRSTDRTEEIVEEFVKKNNKIQLISERDRKGKTSAINLILKHSKGDIIIFVCADNLPKLGSINKLVEKFSDKEVDAVFARPVTLESERKFFGYISHLIWRMHHEYCLIEPKLPGAMDAVRRGIVLKIPSKIVNDDAYLTAIMRMKNKKIVYVPEAIIYLTRSISLMSHIRRRRRIARGFKQLNQLNLKVYIPLRIMFKLTFREICRDPHNIFKILFAVIFEIIANILAYYDTLRGRTPYIWGK